MFLVDLWDRKNDIFPESLDDVIWRQKCIQYGSRKKAAEIVVERYERWAQRNKGPHHRLEVCQVMLEHKDEDHLFAFSDADFTRETFRKLSSQGFDDMTKMLQSLNDPKPAIDDDGHRIGGRHAYLYRCGSEDKWMRPKDHHHHKFSRRSKYPMLEAGIEYWKQFAPNMQ